MPTSSKHPETIVLHGGNYKYDESTNALAVPIYQTTSYQFNNSEHASNLFGFKDDWNDLLTNFPNILYLDYINNI